MSAPTPILSPYGSVGAGTAVPVADGVAIPANTPGLLLLGSDAGTGRRLKVAADGALYVAGSGTLSGVDYAWPTFSVLHVGMLSDARINLGFVGVAAGSAYKACIREVWIKNTTSSSVGSPVIVRFELQNGTLAPESPTASTPVAHDPNDTLDSSITTGYTTATGFGVGSAFSTRYCLMQQAAASTINAATLERCVQQSTPMFAALLGAKPAVVRPGEFFAVVCVESSALSSLRCNVELVFTQEPV